MSADDVESNEAVEAIIKNEEALNAVVEALSSKSRRERQHAASLLVKVAEASPEILVAHGSAFIKALDCKEAQTRWEILDVLIKLIPFDKRLCDRAISGADAALFDEHSGPLRLMAMRFLCRFGATSEKRAEKVWPLIDEAMQCYHGDLEYQDMLIAVTDFAQGKLPIEVKNALADRVRFDAENGKGMLKRRAEIIYNLVS